MAKLTILLGKNLGNDAYVSIIANSAGVSIIQYPEVEAKFLPLRWYPLHPDSFVPQTLELIRKRLAEGKNVRLWTMSEYLVSAIAADVHEHPTYWNGGPKVFPPVGVSGVEIQLWDDDNSGFRKYGIDRDGVLCDAGYGEWPFGWFLPSNV